MNQHSRISVQILTTLTCRNARFLRETVRPDRRFYLVAQMPLPGLQFPSQNKPDPETYQGQSLRTLSGVFLKIDNEIIDVFYLDRTTGRQCRVATGTMT